ncbi:iron-containing alcohol dehydrogenase, partial [Acidimicrobiaceae bacterium USS-CC1]|nr:iron-containing alcohol dehydrogenase [Acidiferrimicrobium australe]
RVTRCRFPQRSGLVADRAATEQVRAALRAGAPDGAVVAGSGTLNDITRYATHLESVDYVSVPTAASMDGYASSVAAMQFDGLKVTFPAHAPIGIFADLRVLAAAPAEMTSWGLGDLLGKVTARFDWVLSEAVTGEAYCPAVADRVAGPLERCAQEPDRLLAADEDGISTLIAGLVESGIAMAMVGSSRPASGAEHHFSHFWDLLAYRGLRPHAPHGLQVAHATAAVMRLQRAALADLDGGLRRPPGQRSADEDPWLGDLAVGAQVDAVRREKAERWEACAARWPPPAPALADARRHLESVTDAFPRVSAALRALGVPATGPDPAAPAGFHLDPPTLRATVRFANRMRSRFTVLDLLDSQGRIDRVADDLTTPRR